MLNEGSSHIESSARTYSVSCTTSPTEMCVVFMQHFPTEILNVTASFSPTCVRMYCAYNTRLFSNYILPEPAPIELPLLNYGCVQRYQTLCHRHEPSHVRLAESPLSSLDKEHRPTQTDGRYSTAHLPVPEAKSPSEAHFCVLHGAHYSPKCIGIVEQANPSVRVALTA